MGCRVLQVQPYLVASILTRGMAAVEPVDVPKDLEVVSVRMNFRGQPLIEVLVRSESFDGDDSATFDVAKIWVATFRRKGQPAAERGKGASRPRDV